MAWLALPGREPLIVPDHMPETIARCLREGWAVVPDPRAQAALPDAEQFVDPDPEQTKARAAEARVAEVKRAKARNAAARTWVERKH